MSMYSLANKYEVNYDYKLAEKCYDELLEMGPLEFDDGSNNYVEYIETCLFQGENETALIYLKKLENQSRTTTSSTFIYGRIAASYKLLGDITNAIKWQNKIVSSLESQEDKNLLHYVKLSLSKYYMISGDFEKARTLIEETKISYKDIDNVNINLRIMFFQALLGDKLEDQDLLEDALKIAIMIDENNKNLEINEKYRINMIEIITKKNRKSMRDTLDARDLLDEVIKLSPSYDSYANMLMIEFKLEELQIYYSDDRLDELMEIINNSINKAKMFHNWIDSINLKILKSKLLIQHNEIDEAKILLIHILQISKKMKLTNLTTKIQHEIDQIEKMIVTWGSLLGSEQSNEEKLKMLDLRKYILEARNST
jgi:tetratricopeptide (TPR) repeat protein